MLIQPRNLERENDKAAGGGGLGRGLGSMAFWLARPRPAPLPLWDETPLLCFWSSWWERSPVLHVPGMEEKLKKFLVQMKIPES